MSEKSWTTWSTNIVQEVTNNFVYENSLKSNWQFQVSTFFGKLLTILSAKIIRKLKKNFNNKNCPTIYQQLADGYLQMLSENSMTIRSTRNLRKVIDNFIREKFPNSNRNAFVVWWEINFSISRRTAMFPRMTCFSPRDNEAQSRVN